MWVSVGVCGWVWVGESEGGEGGEGRREGGREPERVCQLACGHNPNRVIRIDQPPLAGGMLETTPQRRGCRTAPYPAVCVCARNPQHAVAIGRLCVTKRV